MRSPSSSISNKSAFLLILSFHLWNAFYVVVSLPPIHKKKYYFGNLIMKRSNNKSHWHIILFDDLIYLLKPKRSAQNYLEQWLLNCEYIKYVAIRLQKNCLRKISVTGWFFRNILITAMICGINFKVIHQFYLTCWLTKHLSKRFIRHTDARFLWPNGTLEMHWQQHWKSQIISTS